MNDNLLYLILTTFAFLLIGVVIRFYPFRINSEIGIDNWYWLLCAEDVKKRKRLPAKLPYYMLEPEEQWYPPLYSAFLALFPLKLLEKHGGKLSQVIDLAHGVLIFLAVFYIGENLAVAFLAGFSYAIARFPVEYNLQLQPRCLANLFLTLTVIGLYFYQSTENIAFWWIAIGFSLLILFLHKMTTQIWAFYLFGFGLWTMDWKIPALLVISVIIAIVISKGFYLKVLIAHWDIITFWHENINYLMSHQYYESPLYKKDGFISTAHFRPGVKAKIIRMAQLVSKNPFLLVIPIFLYISVNRNDINPLGFLIHSNLESFLWMWLILTILWTVLTTYVPFFTALGAGYFYLYQMFFPLFTLISLLQKSMSATELSWLYGFWAIVLFISGIHYFRLIKALRQSKSALDEFLIQAFEYLKSLPKDGILCIPLILSDATAYKTRKRVFWGGHGFGFNTILKPYYPIMRKLVANSLREKPLHYILFKQGYLESLGDIGLEEDRDVCKIFSNEKYTLYEIVGKDKKV